LKDKELYSECTIIVHPYYYLYRDIYRSIYSSRRNNKKEED